ncbi:MAG: hypothetical protein OXG92_09155 [Chloroflexi bacterium]|nr:hypothetical protein [Chloroflexota bacterium]MCY3716616.1 hypothetical protein [Chloroflexota bacterium]MDE2650479.1 hypothetical protein [Chloroflexota bacterium]MXX50731.1 hypothetical protein [Chloroflexota bacterium]MXX84687.1 hypothetical protein [Chloroflexota bacterium]
MTPADAVEKIMIVPDEVFCEPLEDGDACDVLVRMEDGTVYTALFATVAYIHRQLQLTWLATGSIPETPPVRYAVLDTPHIIVEQLQLEIIEDTIDNLVAQDVFESLFTRVTHDNEPTKEKHFATQEIAQAVIDEVLVLSG